MFFGDISVLFNPKKDETKYYIWQHKANWIVKDSKGNWAIGVTREGAIENYKQLLDRKITVLNEKIERDKAEMKRRHRELWNY